jgi:hypothetical protein
MKWTKKGVIFAPDRERNWMVSHACLPVADGIGRGRLRIYFGTRDARGRSHTSFIEVEADRPENVLYVHDEPLLPLGNPGTFDDSGIMPSWLVGHGGRKYLYYIGWNPQVIVSYRLAIGLAVSEDGGRSFQKISEGPICDRAVDEPYFNTAPCVLREGGVWRMWYVSCTGWETDGGPPEPRYHVKYAESSDGVHWRKTGRVCIDYDEKTGAIGRPCVFREGATYRMIFSFRGVRDYRTDPARSYRFGYAESEDGLVWARRDAEVGIGRSESGWDSEMVEYCNFWEHRGRRYLFYNGNGFGRTGIGYAVAEEG